MRTRCVLMLLSLVAYGCKENTQNVSSTPGTNAAPAEKRVEAVPKGECDDVDDTKLEAVVECLYRAKRTASVWRFESTVSKRELNESEYAKTNDRSGYEFSDVRITKQETLAGSTFAAVSRTIRQRQTDGGMGCSETSTATWIREGLAWRLHGGSLRVAELTEKKFAAGDYSAAAESAEEWLKIDPFSVEAYNILGMAVLRGAKGKSKNDVTRAVLGIDGRNSTALFLAVTMSEDPDLSESYLTRFKVDDCLLRGAVGNVAILLNAAKRPRDTLSLINKPEHAALDPSRFILPRVEALYLLHRAREVPALMTDASVARIRESLEREDPSYAANWSAKIGLAMVEGGEKSKAREWVTYGLAKDPSNRDLARLLRATK